MAVKMAVKQHLTLRSSQNSAKLFFCDLLIAEEIEQERPKKNRVSTRIQWQVFEWVLIAEHSRWGLTK